MSSATMTAAASSTTATMSRPSKHTPVPLLLQSFPVPPSFIPPSPNPATPLYAGPPPSLPPSSPLPPLPGPSPLSDHDALLFLSSGRLSRASVASSSSRRASNVSLTDNRDSVHSSASRRSILSASASPRTTNRDSLSSRSTRSLSGSSSVPSSTSSSSSTSIASTAPPRTPSIALSISELDYASPTSKPAPVTDDPGNKSRYSLASSPEPIVVSPDSDILPPTTGLYRTPRRPSDHPPSAFSPPRAASRASTKSKSSKTKKSSLMSSTSSRDDEVFDMAAGQESIADIKLASEDDDSDLEFVLNHSRLGRGGEVPSTSQGTGDKNLEEGRDEGDASTDALALHRSMRAARSRSGSHRQILTAKNATSKPPPPPLPSSPHTAPLTGGMPSTPLAHQRTRSTSPDIKEILATTPKPVKSRSKSRTRSSRASSLSTSKSWGGAKSTVTSVAGTRSAPGSRRSSAQRGRSSGFSGEVDEFGVMRQGNWGPYHGDFVDDEEEMLERALEGVGSEGEDGGDDSDSSLDLHTPLPNLMVRHGMLSPNSKLLPQSCSTPTADGRPGSVASVQTTMTKSGLIKDERDTPQRRTRHRDGRTLRGGIGLTTGLGWSDSEDEDAPSALTRRLSSLNLSHRSSASSLRSLGASSLSLHSLHAPSSLRTSSYSYNSTRSSTFSGKSPLARSYSHGAVLHEEEGEGYGEEGDDYEEVYKSFDYPTKVKAASMSRMMRPTVGDRDKHLPPLPSLSRQASAASMKSYKAVEATAVPPVPSPRPISNSSSRTSSSSLVPPSVSTSKSTVTSTSSILRPTTPSNRIPRPLQLPRHSAVGGAGSSSSGDRPAVPVPSLPASLSAGSVSSGLKASTSFSGRKTLGVAGLSASTSSPSLIAKSTSGISTPSSVVDEKPKPRTGTGMVYRSSGGSRMRMPSSPMLSMRSRTVDGVVGAK